MPQRVNIFLGAIVSLELVLAGCEVGPNYTRPKLWNPRHSRHSPRPSRRR